MFLIVLVLLHLTNRRVQPYRERVPDQGLVEDTSHHRVVGGVLLVWPDGPTETSGPAHALLNVSGLPVSTVRLPEGLFTDSGHWGERKEMDITIDGSFHS